MTTYAQQHRNLLNNLKAIDLIRQDLQAKRDDVLMPYRERECPRCGAAHYGHWNRCGSCRGVKAKEVAA